MSELKNYLWNSPTSTSTKSKYKNHLLSLTEWPDFGHVGCPKEYIVLSAYLMKQPLKYKQLKKLTGCGEEVINHYIYVCVMLKIMKIDEPNNSKQKPQKTNSLSTSFGLKLKQMFF